jgi:hypothetical protein
VRQLHVGALRQQRHCQVPDTAAADGAVADLARILFGKGDDVSQGLVRLGLGRGDHVGRGANQQHRVEILLGIVGETRKHERIGGVVVEDCQPCIAVGRRFHHRGGANAARRARPVLDHDGGAETMLQPRLDQSHDGVSRAAWRVGDDNSDRAGGP